MRNQHDLKTIIIQIRAKIGYPPLIYTTINTEHIKVIYFF